MKHHDILHTNALDYLNAFDTKDYGTFDMALIVYCGIVSFLSFKVPILFGCYVVISVSFRVVFYVIGSYKQVTGGLWNLKTRFPYSVSRSILEMYNC